MHFNTEKLTEFNMKQCCILPAFRVFLSCLLALALTFALSPTTCLAATSPINLNETWKTLPDSTSSLYTITEGGTYYLSANLDVHNCLRIDAAGKDVIVELNGFTLSSDVSTLQFLEIRAARSVLIKGSSTTKHGKISYKGPTFPHVIDSAADKLEVRNVDIAVAADDDHTTIGNLGAACVYASKGTVNISSCAFNVDQANQGKINHATSGMSNYPAGVILEEGVDKAEVKETKIDVTASPVAEPLTTKPEPAPGYAYGIESKAQALIMSELDVSVQAQAGCCAGVRAENARLEKGGETARNAFTLQAAGTSSTLQGTKQDAFVVAAPIETKFGNDAGDRADYCAELHAVQPGAFVLSAGAKLSDGACLAGASAGSSANQAGMQVLKFDKSLDTAARTALFSQLKNALGDESNCILRWEGDAVQFVEDESLAVAELTTNTGASKKFGSVEDAFNQMGSGDTLRLLKDAGQVALVKQAHADDLFTVDLAGHTLNSLTVDSNAHVVVNGDASAAQSSQSLAQLSGAKSSDSATLVKQGAGELELIGIDVSASANTSQSIAIQAKGTGTLSLTNVNVNSASRYLRAQGISWEGTCGTLNITGGSIKATALDTSVAVTGISFGTAGNLQMVNCDISAISLNDMAGAIESYSDVSISGESSVHPANLNVCTRDVANSAWGLRMRQNGTRASLRDCSVHVSCDDASSEADEMNAYNALQAGVIQSGALSPSTSATWCLDGACSLAQQGEIAISLVEHPLEIGSDFVNKGTTPITVNAVNVSQDICAKSSTPGEDISSHLSAFKAWSESAYGKATLGVSDGAHDSLVWTFPYLVENISKNIAYKNLQLAIDEASAGEHLELKNDASLERSLLVDKPLTIELAGHSLAVNAQAKATARNEGAAIVFSSGGTFTLSNNNPASGGLDLKVGSTGETATSALQPYVGILLNSAGELILDNANVNVSYTGTSSNNPAVTLVGVRVGTGSLALEGATHLRVLPYSGGYGAQLAYGVTFDDLSTGESRPAADSNAVRIEENASLTVQNDTPLGVLGTVNAQSSARTWNLVQIHPEENSALYEEIQQKFYEQALFDYQGEPGGNVYGLGVYYAAPLQLDDGCFVFAFSDAIDVKDIGKREAIKATHMFTQANYNSVSEAIGISGDSDAASRIDIRGAVEAKTQTGDACAFLTDTGDDWQVAATAQVRAESGKAGYWALDKLFNLRDFTGDSKLEAGLDANATYVYPSTATCNLLSAKMPAAFAALGQGANSITWAEGASVSETSAYEDAPAYENALRKPETVELSFTGVRDAQGDLVASENVTVPYGATLAGKTLPQPENYDADGRTYRFIGWRIAPGSVTSNVWDAIGFAEKVSWGDSIPAASSGKVTLTAVYVPVSSGQHLVSFSVDSYVTAYSAQDGQRAQYKLSKIGASSSFPGKIESQTGYTYTFTGWTQGTSGNLLAGALPKASSDMRFVAHFKETPQLANVNFYYWKSGITGGQYYSAAAEKMRYFSDPTNSAQSKVQPGNTIITGGDTKRTFLGWSVRATDNEPLFGNALPPVYANPTNFYGVYESSAFTPNVVFHVGAAEYARAEAVSAATTIDGAYALAGKTETPDAPSEDQVFKGWAVRADSSTYLRGTLVTVGSLSIAGEDINLYAVFLPKKTTLPSNETAPGTGNGTGNTSGGTGANNGNANGSDNSTNGNSNDGDQKANPSTPSSLTRPGVLGSLTNSSPIANALAGNLQKESNVSSAFANASPALANIDGADSDNGAVVAEEASLFSDTVDATGSSGDADANTVAFVALLALLLLAGIGAIARTVVSRRKDDADDDYFDPLSLDEAQAMQF